MVCFSIHSNISTPQKALLALNHSVGQLSKFVSGILAIGATSDHGLIKVLCSIKVVSTTMFEHNPIYKPISLFKGNIIKFFFTIYFNLKQNLQCMYYKLHSDFVVDSIAARMKINVIITLLNYFQDGRLCQ